MTATDLRCPACGRWLAEVAAYAKLVCSGCGAEVTYRSKDERRRCNVPAPIGVRIVGETP